MILSPNTLAVIMELFSTARCNPAEPGAVETSQRYGGALQEFVAYQHWIANGASKPSEFGDADAPGVPVMTDDRIQDGDLGAVRRVAVPNGVAAGAHSVEG